MSQHKQKEYKRVLVFSINISALNTYWRITLIVLNVWNGVWRLDKLHHSKYIFIIKVLMVSD